MFIAILTQMHEYENRPNRLVYVEPTPSIY